MGGYGSGQRLGYSTKRTTEEVKHIDIRYMRKQGFLKRGVNGVLNWTSGGKPRGSIRYICLGDYLQLNYRYSDGGAWQTVEQFIEFDRTPCNFGGERFWFCCPACSKRVALLYGRSSLFVCRHCCKLGYASQQEGYIDNMVSQQHKLGKRIFERYEGGKGYGKKKGMHWKTYWRLYAKYKMLEQAWCQAVVKYLDREML